MEGDSKVGKIYTTAVYMKEVMPVYHEMIRGVVVGCTPIPTPAHGGDVDLGNDFQVREAKLEAAVA